ncbi:MAG TPA: FAD binding domain-containing protein, partial [Gemmataceae bacterium]
MKHFTYYRPQSAEEAVGLLDAKWGKTELLAGGTDLLDLMKEYVAQPDKVVSISGGDQRIGFGNGGETATISANSTLSWIAQNQRLGEVFPALTTAAGQIGGPQIRNMGT